MLSSSLHWNAASLSGLMSSVTVDPRILAITVNAGISKVIDSKRWGAVTLAPCTIITCETGGTLLNRNPLTPIQHENNTKDKWSSSNYLQRMQVPPSNWQQKIPSVEEFMIKIISFPMYEYLTSNSKGIPIHYDVTYPVHVSAVTSLK